MSTRTILSSLALLAAAAASAQPVTSPLGALGRTNEAVSAAESSQSSGSETVAPDPVSPAPSTGGMGLLPPDADDDEPEGGEIRTGSYDPEGRRDPFRALTGEAADTEERKKWEGTLKGRLLSEVKLTSILKHPQGNIATLEGGPKKEGYFARAGAELWDGTVVTVDADNLVIVVRQKVDDPRMIKPWRDIVIPLWSEEEKKAEGATAP
jgi:hypothetical protein